MPQQSITEDKHRVLAIIEATLKQMPDSPEEVERLIPHLDMQIEIMLSYLGPEDPSPGEKMALAALLGPIFCRTPMGAPLKSSVLRPTLRAV